MGIDDLRALYRKHVPRRLRILARRAIAPRRTLFDWYAFHRYRAVQSGPFAGMRFEVGCGDATKLLGTYEMELHEPLARLLASDFPVIVDVGAAEGYYAVGLALRYPGKRVIAYEALEPLRAKVDHLAQLNRVATRIDLRGFCDPPALRELGDALRGALLVVDIEGYEDTLLDPAQVPALAGSTILVETHDHEVPGCHARVIERFAASHRILSYQSRPRTARDLPVPLGAVGRRLLTQRGLVEVISDDRAVPNGWLLLEPLA
jgi:hypothetical protein